MAGMHYSGMEAVQFIPNHNLLLPLAIQTNQRILAGGVSVVTLVILAIGILTALAQTKIRTLEKITMVLEQKVADRTKELNEKNKELDRALSQAIEYAALVQKGFLPEKAPHFPDYQISAKTIPARTVGGDFYDFIPLGNNQLGILLGDVSGKGVKAALYMAKLVSDFRYISQSYHEPELIMKQINERLFKRSEGGMFATAIFCRLNMKEKTLTISNAGHPGLLVKNQDRTIFEKGKAHGPPLGILPNSHFSKEDIQLKPGQLIFAYTDGVTEPQNLQKDQFGLERLQYVISQNDDDPNKLIDHLEKSIKQFVNSLESFDDLTCLALKVK